MYSFMLLSMLYWPVGRNSWIRRKLQKRERLGENEIFKQSYLDEATVCIICLICCVLDIGHGVNKVSPTCSLGAACDSLAQNWWLSECSAICLLTVFRHRELTIFWLETDVLSVLPDIHLLKFFWVNSLKGQFHALELTTFLLSLHGTSAYRQHQTRFDMAYVNKNGQTRMELGKWFLG